MQWFVAAVCAGSALLLSSCGSVKEYGVTAGNENLAALTKITDNVDQKAQGLTVAPGSSTLFIALSDGKQCNIYKKENPLSAAMSQITSGNVWTNYPAYNVADNRLAFTYQTPLTNGWSHCDIYMIDLNNVNALIPITQTSTTGEFSPSFSNDGSVVVYQSNSGANGEIWVKNTKTNESILIGKGMQPKISPDGKKVVFARYKTTGWDSPSSIWTMNIDGTDVAQLTNNPDERAFMPAWSPDGKKIIYSSTIKGKKKDNDLYIINSDGTGLMQITTNESYEGTPVWSTDGYIYFISDRGNKANNYQVWRFVAPR